MQTIKATIVMCGILLGVLSLKGQVLICPGEEIRFEIENPEYYGEGLLEYSAEGEKWEVQEWELGMPWEARVERTGYYRLGLWDKSCDTVYRSAPKYVDMGLGYPTSVECTLGWVGQVEKEKEGILRVDNYDDIEGLHIESNGKWEEESSGLYRVREWSEDLWVVVKGRTDKGCEISSDTLRLGEMGNQRDFPPGAVFCETATPTQIVEVMNPMTGKAWMDRNLGATAVAEKRNEEGSYGDLYQWGRLADGHQCRNSSTRMELSSSDSPGHNDFILTNSQPFDWRTPKNDNLWQGLEGINNPCPQGYRIPTEMEWEAERDSWSLKNSVGALNSVLRLPAAGGRSGTNGEISNVGFDGRYWSSTVSGNLAVRLGFNRSSAIMSRSTRTRGGSVRCIRGANESVLELDCEGVVIGGEVYLGVEVTGLVVEIGYSGGQGMEFGGGEFASTGVEGLRLLLSSGTLMDDSGTIPLVLTGIADSLGVAVFEVSIGGVTCRIEIEVKVESSDPDYPPGTVHCDPDNPTAVVDVLNPATGKTWMDRNLGASRVAQAFDDPLSYGDLYQWGRLADGHQCRNSPTTPQLSSSDVPGHGDFITTSNNSPYDWRSPQNDNLWQGVNGVNNPCPRGYRVPTESELNEERLSWSSNNTAGAFASPLNLTLTGARLGSDSSPYLVGQYGYYWSSTVNGILSRDLFFSFGSGSSGSDAGMDSDRRADGRSVRCLKEEIVGEIQELDCLGATVSEEVVEGEEVNGVTVKVDYTGGNGGSYVSQQIASTGVLGLTASLPAGQFNVGVGSVVLTITGSAQSSGVAVFVLELGGQSCEIEVEVMEGEETSYPPGTVHCDPDNITLTVDVLNPVTGKTWMDRNLGASQVAQAFDDPLSYGDLYQWGRRADGHQCRTSLASTQFSISDVPDHGDFIVVFNPPFDWRIPQNDNLWQGVNGVNNPCPRGYRVPTESELNTERLSWGSNNASGAFASPLNLPSAGSRFYGDASIDLDGISGVYWSSSVSSSDSRYLVFSSNASILSSFRALGFSVRCIKD